MASKRRISDAGKISQAIAKNAGKSGKEVRRIISSLTQGTKDFQETKEEYKAGLDAADPSNRYMRARWGLGGSGDAHMHHSKLWWVRETSRHMVLNDDLIGQGLVRLADNIVQDTGFRLKCNTGDETLDLELEQMAQEWGENPALCDFYGERTWAQIQWISQFQTSQDGEIFALPIDNGTIQLIEAERCLTFRGQDDHNYLGLTFDDQNKVIAYHFTEKPLGPYQTQQVGPTRPIMRYDDEGFLNVFHMRDTKRVTQHRGLPWIIATMVKLGMLDDLQFAMLVKAQSCAAHAALIEQDPKYMTPGSPPQLGPRTTITQNDPNGGPANVLSDSLRYGQYTPVPAGYKLSGFTPSVPNSEFFQHVRESIRQVGANLSMPVEMMLLDASSTNFSGWRGAMDQARMGFKRWQRQLSGQLHYPTYKFLFRRWAVTMGAVARQKLQDGTLFRFKVTPPAWSYINPKEDAEAGNLLVTTGQASPSQLAASRGFDYTEIVDETVRDRAAALTKAIAAAQKIELDTGYVISPLLLLGWNLPANSALIGQTEEMTNEQRSITGAPGTKGDDDETDLDPPDRTSDDEDGADESDESDTKAPAPAPKVNPKHPKQTKRTLIAPMPQQPSRPNPPLKVPKP